ncbi:MAG: choice-of-anchor D domain-containing protein, partial [Thermodesulfobacteriota bacterium]|nr:choice-of-anchor D domain-containing protein [Thermodesulfobacteriota bacterium]
SNAGNDNLVLGTVAQANPLAAPFSVIEDNCSLQTLVPASSCTLTVQFAPNATSPFSDSFDIPSNDPDTPSVTVAVDGTGTGVPVPDIAVTDSVAPNDDLEVPFGDVKEGESSEETVTVTNAGTADLVIGTVAFTDNLAAPFSIPAGMDTCSDTTLAPSESCTITVQFAPTALVASNDTFDIPSDDPDTPSVTVAVSGTGVPNIAPSAPALVLPADGATGLPTSVTFEWNNSTDADGDTVTYDLYVCTDNTFATCSPVNSAPITASATGATGFAFAASGMGVMFFGVAFVAGIGRKKTVALLLAMALAAGVLMVACGDDDGGSSSPHGQVSFTQSGLTTTTTYYWKVVANDGSGGSTDSATRSFTTQ